jgi:hypothetical protein
MDFAMYRLTLDQSGCHADALKAIWRELDGSKRRWIAGA